MKMRWPLLSLAGLAAIVVWHAINSHDSGVSGSTPLTPGPKATEGRVASTGAPPERTAVDPSPSANESQSGAGSRTPPRLLARGEDGTLIRAQLVSEQGQPKPGLLVQVVDTSSGDARPFARRHTDEEGVVRFTVVPAAVSYLTCVPYCLNGQPGLFVDGPPSGSTVDLGHVVVSEGDIVFEGRIVSPGGLSIGGARVTVGQHSVLTDGDGRFSMMMCEAGPYTVTTVYRHPGEPHDILMRTVEVSGGRDTVIELTPNQVLLLLYDAEAYVPLRTADVEVIARGPGGRHFAFTATAGAECSRIRFNQPLAAGTWMIEVVVPGYVPWSSTLDIPAYVDLMPEMRVNVMLKSVCSR
ncbi:MAG: carboxypeptidase regulatory-like domain-containing protein [Planctomycetes bacterium]|nr:carboxypeptidase regulatory-like domain-containing protein [Planctomycetota bacterium]